MKSRQFVTLVGMLLLATYAATAAGAPKAYVAATNTIYSVDTGTSAATALFTDTTASFQGLVLGPDQRLYACDPANDRILSLDTTTPNQTNPSVFYNGSGALHHARCGVFGADGSLYVTSRDSGSGVWRFSCAVPLLSTPPAPASCTASLQQVLSSTQLSPTFQGGQIAISNQGNLIFSDTKNKKIYLSYAPGYASAAAIISGLSAPVGVARNSFDQIFVADAGAKTVIRCNSNGTGCQTYANLNQQAPQDVKFAADDTLYVSTTRNSKGALFSISPTAAVTSVATLDAPTQGVGLPLTSYTKAKSTYVNPQNYYFGFTSFENTADCSGPFPVSQTQTAPSVINGLLSHMPNPPTTPATPLTYPGENGAATVYTANPAASGVTCSPSEPDGLIHWLIGTFAHPSNPRVVKCDNGDTVGTSCILLVPEGIYPLNGPMPGDGGLPAGGGGYSYSFPIEVAPSTDAAVAGTFCGFQSPLVNTVDPALAKTFDLSSNPSATMSVKFKLAKTAGGSCKNGDYINSATAILSIAQITDGAGNPVFVPMRIDTSGNSQGSFSPTFNNNNNQYQLSVSLTGFSNGTYGLSMLFVTSNTVAQTIVFNVTGAP